MRQPSREQTANDGPNVHLAWVMSCHLGKELKTRVGTGDSRLELRGRFAEAQYSSNELILGREDLSLADNLSTAQPAHDPIGMIQRDPRQ